MTAKRQGEIEKHVWRAFSTLKETKDIVRFAHAMVDIGDHSIHCQTHRELAEDFITSIGRLPEYNSLLGD